MQPMNQNLHILVEQRGYRPLILESLRKLWPTSNLESDTPGFTIFECSADFVLRHSYPFATQLLPSVEKLSSTSAANWGELLAQKIISQFEKNKTKWRLHVFTIGKDETPLVSKYCSLIEERAKTILAREQRAILNLCERENKHPWREDEEIVQLLLVDNNSGYLSISKYDQSNLALRTISRFPGGMLRIKADKRPPSRAYQKILEIELRLGKQITAGESCVDLGASPGGWSFIALERGAKVIAVDRSELREDLMRNKNLNFIKADGFKYTPDAPVDWMLCDVAAYPQRSIDLLEFWLSKKLCKHFAVTLKFKGSEDYSLVHAAEEIAMKYAKEVYIQHLLVNKNEVSVFGTCSKNLTAEIED